VREHSAEVLLGGAVRRPVIVGEVEVRDPEIEGAPDDRAAGLEREVVSEVVPEPERQSGQQQPTASRPSVLHALVAIVGRDGGHFEAEA
jgi:hypothetical protein